MKAKFFLLFTVHIILITICSSALDYNLGDTTSIAVDNSGSDLPDGWYKNGVFYEIFVREFYDTDGDGAGDIRGVIKKLDYLKELGITGIWLMPITKSYDNDHGYAVEDYMNIELNYGTMEDFEELIHEAHKRGIGIIIDLVINHCSHMHPYFKEAAANPDSKYRDWFIWSDTDLYWRQPWSMRQVWHKASNEKYYFGLFSSWMPDFNYRNEEVYTYIKDVMAFWLNKGVDGFRIDAAKHLIENGAGKMTDQPETIHIFKGLRKVVNRYPHRFMIGEAESADYLGDGKDGLNSCFNFGLTGEISRTFYYGDSSYLYRHVQNLYDKLPDGAFYSNILGNHDSFTGPRVMTRFTTNPELAKSGAVVLLTLPGIPFVYYGEEIGMTSKNIYQYDDSLRTPMQWDTTRNGGFSTSLKIAPRKTNPDYKKINAAAQLDAPDSMLTHYKTLIHLREQHDSLKNGSLKLVKSTKEIFMFERANGNEKSIVIVNISAGKVKLPITDLAAYTIIFGNKNINVKTMELAPYTSLILNKKYSAEKL